MFVGLQEGLPLGCLFGVDPKLESESKQTAKVKNTGGLFVCAAGGGVLFGRSSSFGMFWGYSQFLGFDGLISFESASAKFSR